MKLSELLVKELVILPLEAADKWQAIAALARAPVRAGRVPASAEREIEQALVAREKSRSTGMERGIAIPHAAVDVVGDVQAVLGISRAGIPFETLDREPVRIVVGLVIPRQKKLLHIKTLAEIAKLLAPDGVRRQLLECTSPEQVLAVIKKGDGG